MSVSTPSEPGVDGPPEHEAVEGDAVGRYTIVGRLGQGGMSQVFAAYDPELDREVALKLIRPGRSEESHGRQRLLREAQALARLSHPNVVAVHDVGTHERQVFIAMEKVEGSTLARWIVDEQPTWLQAVDCLLQAGEGLAAAHAAGLVHRDFKPSNVMVRPDGRVSVLDFGLVRGTDAADRLSEDPEEPVDISGSFRGLASGPLTQTGVVMGTPKYMAPEQFAGVSDARVDQYAFCVVLFEAVYGRRPFGGDTYDEIRRAVIAGSFEFPARPRIPAALRAVIAKGLRTSPDDRFVDVRGLLRAVRRARGAPRRRTLLLGSVAATAVVGAGVYELSQREEPCRGTAEKLEHRWGDEQRRAVGDALAQAGTEFARDNAARVVDVLDDYAAGWVEARKEACRATRVTQEQSEALMDLRIACLDDRLGDLVALAELLREPGASEHDALEAARGLRPLGPCSDANFLTAALQPPEDAETRAAVDEARQLMSKARAETFTGKLEASLKTAGEARAAADATAYLPVVAESWFVLGRARFKAHDLEGAREGLEEALYTATEARHEFIQAHALAYLVDLTGYHLAEPNAGERFLRLGRAVVERLDSPPLLEARLEISAANMALRQGDLDRAGELYGRISAIESDDPDLAEVAVTALNNSVAVYGRLGDHERARVNADRAVALMEDLYGEHHLQTGRALANAANPYYSLGHPERAVELAERGRAIHESAGFGRSVAVATIGSSLRLAYAALGDHEKAFEEAKRAFEIKVELQGSGHPSTVLAANNYGDALMDAGRLDEAVGLLRKTIDSTRESERIEPRIKVGLAVTIAEAYVDLGQGAPASEAVEEARTHIEGIDIDPVEHQRLRWLDAAAQYRLDEDPDHLEAVRAVIAELDGQPGEPVAVREDARTWLDAQERAR